MSLRNSINTLKTGKLMKKILRKNLSIGGHQIYIYNNKELENQHNLLY